MEKLPAASAMQWSIDLDRGLRSRHAATRLHALDAVGPRLRELGASPVVPAAVASAFGILPAEPHLFAQTMLLRLATEFRGADNVVRARIVRSLLVEYRELATKGRAYDGALARPRVAEPEQVLRRVKAVYDTGCVQARALALRMFGCLAHLAEDSVHIRSLLLSSLSSSSAAEVKAALFAAGCFCRLSEDFSCITLEALGRLISSPKSEAEVIKAAIKTFPKLDCTLAVIHRVHQVGKQIVLGTLEDIFKADMLLSLSRLTSKSVLLFGDQVELLLLFLGIESSLFMKTTSLKCLCFMFHGNTCHFPVLRNVFSTLLHLIDSDCLPLDCKSYTLRILQRIVTGKAPIVHCINTCELSKLFLAAENSLHSSSWEMQGTALKVLSASLCFLQQTRPDQNIISLEGSSFTCSACQGITNNLLSTRVENVDDKFIHKIVTSMVNHSISLVNQVISTGKNGEARQNIHISSELKKCRSMFSSMLKLVVCYPFAAAVALDRLRCLIKELARLDDSDYSEVSVTNVESIQTNYALEVLDTSNDIVKPVVGSMKASHMETDYDKLKLDSTKFSRKKEVPVVENLILWTLKFASSCHNMLCKASGTSRNLHDSIKELIQCVQQNASQYCSTYEFFHLTMCACISWNACKIRDGNQESGDSKLQPDIFSTPVWINQEQCAIRVAKMLFRKKRYWDAYRSAMYCCCKGLWFTASFVFRNLADAFGSGSFSFWFKSLLLFSAGENEMKLLVCPSVIIKLVGELKTDGDLCENFYCVETDVDNTLGGSSELHGCQAKVTDIRSRTFLAIDSLSANISSDCELFFQRWFISLRASFLDILANLLGILSAHCSAQKEYLSHHEAIGDHSSVPKELLALANCSLGLSDLAQSYDLLAVSHGDMDQQSFSSIARLALMSSLLSFCIAFSVDFSKVSSSVEAGGLPERFSLASIVQDLHQRVYRTDSQAISQLQQFMPAASDEAHFLQFVTRMDWSGILEKDCYFLCKFAVAYLLRTRGDAKGIGNISCLHGGMQFLSSILQRFMQLPFAVPKYFFRVRSCFGAELDIYDSNPANREGISVPPGFQLSLALCLQWKCVLERTCIDISKLYCILAASSASHSDVLGTRSKEFDIDKTIGMVVLNRKLQQYIKDDLRINSNKKKNVVRSDRERDLVTAFACFEPSDSGFGFSCCLLDVSAFPQGSYKIQWQACCMDKDGCYYSLLPLSDGPALCIQNGVMGNR